VFDARLEKLLRVVYPVKGPAEMDAEMLRVFMGAVRQVSFAMSPNLFDRIEFRCIRWEWENVEAWGVLQKNFDVFSFVDLTIVPNHDHVPAEVTHKMLQVMNDFGSRDVVCVETNIKSQPLSTGGHGEAANNRDLVTPIAVAENGCTTGRSPGSTNVRYEQEPAFVEKCQMGPKFLGFFLYGAMFAPSSGRWLPRLFATPVFPASGNSTPDRCAIISTRLHVCSELRSLSESDGPLASKSIGRWNVQRLLLLAAAVAPIFLFGGFPTKTGVPTWLGSECLADLSCDSSDTTARQNSTRLSTLRLRRDKFAPREALLSLDTAVSPTDRDFHEVSCLTL